MIVDDALIMRMRIRQIAERSGWTVVAEADNGEDAISLYEEHAPDLVTLDMVMPRLDGIGALTGIRGINGDAQVVMVSAVNQKEKLAECIGLGAVDFIVKPFEPERLQQFFEHYRQASE